MFALHLTLLTDRFAASSYNSRVAAEWPPHPGRVFSALVDALHEDGEAPDPDEAAALDALAALPPPVLLASPAYTRRVMTVYVPVNDEAVVGTGLEKREEEVEAAQQAQAAAQGTLDKFQAQSALSKAEGALLKASREASQPGSRGGTPKDAEKVLPWNRTKQPRTFPAMVPEDPRVSYLWEAPAPPALAPLLERVARIGHSSSFVSLSLEEGHPIGEDDRRLRWVPDPDGSEQVRVMAPGQRAVLESAFRLHQGDQPGRVIPSAFQRYRVADRDRPVLDLARSRGRWVAYQLPEGRSLPGEAAQDLAMAVRGAILAHADEPVHPLLSGHGSDGPLRAEHLAVLPLPFVGHPHADGRLRGFALSLPPGERVAEQALLRALARWEDSPTQLTADEAEGPTVEVGFSNGWSFLAERVVDEDEAPQTVRRARWSTPCRWWGSALPIVLDGECDPFDHPNDARRRKAWRTAEKLLSKSLRFLLPDALGFDPSEVRVELRFSPPVIGGLPLRQVGAFQRSGHARSRRQVHAVFELPVPVRGPLVVGGGRHFGLGLCVPLTARAREST